MPDKVLIVEDDINTLNGLSEILEEENFKIGRAKNARQAQNEMKKNYYNVVL